MARSAASIRATIRASKPQRRHPRTTGAGSGALRRLSLLVVLQASDALAAPQQNDAAGAANAIANKLDDGLDDPAARRPVFVRMADQVFPRGGAFEQFCAEHATTPRSQLRRQVLADLRQKSERSWQQVRTAVAELHENGSLRHVTRYWIVNGFAAEATGAACQALATLPAVDFVYLQRQPGGGTQHELTPRAERWRAERRRDLERALAMLGDATTDEEPFDPSGLVVPWNLQRIGADRAWAAGATGQGVVVAICDSGVLVTPPIVRALWRNPGETLDGKDEDGNGFVDDVLGYDVAGGTPWAVGDGPHSHGTMCAGIVAGRAFGEPATVTGVAPRARLMVLRAMGSLRAYEYAAANGADVLSLSYMWIGIELGNYRGLFRTAHEHLAACGIVAVGGAGNFRKTAPRGRQIALPKDIPCVIAAAGILENGTQAEPSSEGPCTWQGVKFFDDHPPQAPLVKPDVTGVFGGYPVWHWTQLRGRRLQVEWAGADGIGLVRGPQGNSFSGPHAAGVAALMLQVNPELTPWRVKALMEGTCRDLGAEGRDVRFGAGLLQAAEAVAAARAAVVAR